jgi:nucleoside-diphosphate-sugar epimerase
VFDLAARIRRLAGSESEIVFRPLHYTDVEMRIPNVEKARKLLGWEPQVDLDDGLARTIGWYRERQPVQSLAPSA